MANISPITQRILDLDPTLQIHNEGEWSGTKSLFSAFNDAGVECEVGEFLYAVTRLLKPQNVLETGTHWGIGATYIGHAIKDNGHGFLQTLEFNNENFIKADERLHKQGLEKYATTYLLDVSKVEANNITKYDLIFLDTEPQTRFSELEKFYPMLNEGGYIFIHDLHRHMHQIPVEGHEWGWPYGKIPKEMDYLIKHGDLRPFHFPTPRGFTGFYKQHSGDHYFDVYK